MASQDTASLDVASPETVSARRPMLGTSGRLAPIASDAALLLATVLVAATLHSVQWATPSIIGIDGHFHIKLSAIMREQGWGMLRLDFPWLPTTILNAADFTDHHLLFHLLLVPFTVLDLRVAAKLATVMFASLTLLMVYQLMAEHRVRYPLVWMLVLLASSAPFLYRLSQTRRQGLTLLLLLLANYLAFKRRERWLVPLGFAFSWLFDGFPLLLGVCGAAFLGDWWERRRPSWGLVVYPALGVALGTLINPYFPNNVVFSFHHMLPKIVQLLGLEQGDVVIRVGNEWYPYSQDYLWRANWLAMLLPVLGLVPILADPRPRRLRALDGRVVTLLILAATFVVLFLRSRRWIEAEPIFATLFCAFAWNHALPERPIGRLMKHLPSLPRGLALGPAMAVGAAAILAPLFYQTVQSAMSETRGSRDTAQFRDAAHWLAANTPAGTRVYQTDWDDFPELFFWNTHNTYLIGLDPTYMYLHDGPLYLQWRAIGRGQVERPSATIRDVFDSGYVVTDRDHSAFLRHAANDPDLVEVFANRTSVVYRVSGWQPPGHSSPSR